MISENYFHVRHKNRQKHNKPFKLLIFELNSHLGPPNYIATFKKLNLLHINSVYLVFSSL